MPDIAWVNGQISEIGRAKVPLLDRGYLFGDGVYEVLRVYRGRPFALDEHMERLADSLAGVRINYPLVSERLRTLIDELVAQAGYAEASVYLQITRGASVRQHAFPAGCEPSLVLTVTKTQQPERGQQEGGVGVITVPDDRWAHCHIKSVNLLPNVLAKQKAREAGAFEAVFVRAGNRISEGSSSNIFAVKDGVMVTPPLDGHILPGVTRRMVLSIARQEGFPVREEDLPLEFLRQAEEVFLTGTTIEVLPVTKIGGTPLGSGIPGPVTRAIFQAFTRKTESQS
ncbi:D-amino-acid transaminase [Acididesulfobacillus acetoxydans]|uniref:D-alanine aminotransferase n=1 Tax=Acididesulfobacillus acetoxydans TaxID=1561005 RepID=A0A8S0VWN3_9FIRM|nr:D-amino-acid transaminase [Acididesulfobacillus acetoxydans]CAA7601053.1 D-amino-acid transaminase [Acididesulfobacillus acetoxydans]CEJ06927.1 D-alanine aminotransferase [Acididesulfobacillus acetoxydans]